MAERYAAHTSLSPKSHCFGVNNWNGTSLWAYEVGERTASIWPERSKTICPLSGDGVSFNQFAMILIIRKETLVLC